MDLQFLRNVLQSCAEKPESADVRGLPLRTKICTRSFNRKHLNEREVGDCCSCSRNRTRPHAKCMFFGFSGFLPHVIGLFRLFSAPEAFMLPASKAGVRGGGGVGGGDDDMHCL